jgi:hypothetical protein
LHYFLNFSQIKEQNEKFKETSNQDGLAEMAPISASTFAHPENSLVNSPVEI